MANDQQEEPIPRKKKTVNFGVEAKTVGGKKKGYKSLYNISKEIKITPRFKLQPNIKVIQNKLGADKFKKVNKGIKFQYNLGKNPNSALSLVGSYNKINSKAKGSGYSQSSKGKGNYFGLQLDILKLINKK